MDADRGVANTGALLEIVRRDQVEHRYMIDCGFTAGQQLRKLGLCFQDVDAVLLTHPHGDHIDGLEGLGYQARYEHRTHGKVIAPGPALEAAWDSLRAKMRCVRVTHTTTAPVQRDSYFELVDVAEEPFDLADGQLRLRFFPVPHIPSFPAYGLEICYRDGARIRWSGDTTLDAESCLFRDVDAKRGDLIFHDCNFGRHPKDAVHAHCDELSKLEAAVRERIVLIHHGREDPHHPPVERMVVGQPFQRFSFRRES